MVITNSGKSGLALLLTVSGTRPNFIEIGTGSAAVTVTRTGLITGSFGVAPTMDLSTVNQITFTSVFSSTQMSGVKMTEFGLKVSGASNALWNCEGFGSITFDGTIEAQIEITPKIY